MISFEAMHEWRKENDLESISKMCDGVILSSMRMDIF